MEGFYEIMPQKDALSEHSQGKVCNTPDRCLNEDASQVDCIRAFMILALD